MIVALSAMTLSMLFLSDSSTMTFPNILGVMNGISMDHVMSAAFAAAILFVSILFRNKGLGFLFSCMLGTGGIVMGIEWAFEALRF